mmetsp:Transcript_6351/g.14099  ORF Transcript_6351/g.14099 Transcript_6351/m.14099 type:complete len:222 (+) Transcript_6351:21-686(+)
MICLIEHLSDDTRADSTPAFAKGETQTRFHGHWVNEFKHRGDVIAGHDHFGALRKGNVTGDICRAHEELRTVVGKERCVTASFFFLQDVNLRFELGVRLDRTRLAQHLTAQNFVALQAAKQQPAVVPSLAFVQRLLEHFNTSDGGLFRGLNTHNIHVVTGANHALFDAPSGHRTSSLNAKNVLHRHGEGLVKRARGLRNVRIDRRHEFNNLFLTNCRFRAL